MAEVKRASPSKKDIAPHINAAKQGLLYARAGAAAISCLTEPKWFKGSIQDLRDIRDAIDGLENRPALLRKEFIVDPYQIYEARAYGADTLLLIVASLEEADLVSYLKTSRELGMEPLVEVANESEMKIALKVGAKVIGVNNRNLHTFTVDNGTTERVTKGVDMNEKTICALSGISKRSDVELFEKVGARAVLVGEALMRSPNPMNKINELKGVPITYVKICGIKNVEDALATVEAGADFIGLVFASKSKRLVSVELAKEITKRIHTRSDVGITAKQSNTPTFEKSSASDMKADAWYTECAKKWDAILKVKTPLVVGVFADQDIDEVNRIAAEVDLDVIQFSGDEPFDVCLKACRPAWKAVHVGNDAPDDVLKRFVPSTATCVLLDTRDPSAKGGTGKKFDWSIAASLPVPIILAGGLDPINVSNAVSQVRPFALDVSSGVETEGKKDMIKIRNFIREAKSAM
eukprot:CAMPEP_0168521494 /NCGR_PEP_ID=MMETSP0405-20121227/8700_1 /TAXON_ID=498012 /ORGANISM="Trichosphaerium sp, Strain Am-I-7 wt" /LENGTH=462 /DNA_ID=CAMNT_0008542745 /DNA_START=225 /DNA_END=1613 /DNA_ORIENTATION=-